MLSEMPFSQLDIKTKPLIDIGLKCSFKKLQNHVHYFVFSIGTIAQASGKALLLESMPVQIKSIIRYFDFVLQASNLTKYCIY